MALLFCENSASSASFRSARTAEPLPFGIMSVPVQSYVAMDYAPLPYPTADHANRRSTAVPLLLRKVTSKPLLLTLVTLK